MSVANEHQHCANAVQKITVCEANTISNTQRSCALPRPKQYIPPILIYIPIPMNQKTSTRQRRHLRIRARIKGTSEAPRLLVFRSNTHTYAQLINDEEGKVILASSDMKSGKGTKTENAKKIGSEIAKLAKEKGITKIVFDRNGYKYHGRVKAVAESAREGGLQF